VLAIGRALMNRRRCFARRAVLACRDPGEEIFTIIRRVNETGHVDPAGRAKSKVRWKTAHYGYVLEIGRVVMNEQLRAADALKDIQEFYRAKEAGAGARARWKKKKRGV